MNRLMMWLRLIVAVIGLGCVLAPATVLAADDDDNRDRPAQIQRPTAGQPVCPPGMCAMPGRSMRCPVGRCVFRCLLAWLAVVHVLLASWVYSDIRKRGEGHGIFIVLVLLAGLPATILYALVRIGDSKRT
jgi:hypothetical protein